MQVAAVAALCIACGAQPAGAQQAGAPEADARPVVLIALPAVEPEAQQQLREALLAQFALLPAEPQIENDPEAVAGTSLGQRMSNAQARGAALAAIAVFWIDPQPDGRWLLHMMDSASERILVRAVDARSERRQASIEAVAVMVRESTRALIEGGPIGEPALSPSPTPSVQAGTASGSSTRSGAAPGPESDARTATEGTAVPAGERPFRIWLGYHADEFAYDFALQHGVAIGAGWFGLAPFHIGANFTLGPPATVENLQISFDVQRFQVGLSGGYRHRLGIVVFDFEAGPILEVASGSVPESLRGPGYVLESPTATRKTVFGLSGRLRAELFAVPTLSLFAAAGLDALFNNSDYITMELDPESSPVTVLRVMPVRPVAEVGLAFYP